MVDDETDRTIRDAEPEAAPSSDMRLAGRYRLRGILGRGGMGTVYRAEDVELGELIALKIVSKGSASADGAQRQRDEVKLARRVTHPNVARTFDLGEHGRLRFITMELVDGPSLRDVIGGETSLDERLVLIRHVALGLAAIHDAGIAHRDLKPENVLVSSAGVAKITDFGIARPATALAPGMTTGTPTYMAPEVLAGAPPTPAADLYALGLVAAEAITGERFRGGDLAPLKRKLERALGAGHRAIPLVLQCLADDPTMRPKSASALGELLDAGRAAATASVPPSTIPRVRVSASVFAADPSDAWLADSLPDRLLRGLSRSPELEVISALLPPAATTRTALAHGADVVLQGSVQRTGDNLRFAVRVVSTEEELTLWARTDVISIARIDGRLSDFASEICLALSDRPRPQTATNTMQEPRVAELLLRAAHEDHDPWRDVSTTAVDLLEEARRLAPDDPTVLASLALALLRGGGIYDEERFQRARDAALRAVELEGASADSQHALAVTLLLSNDPLGALDCLRAILRVAPSMADAHSMVAAIAGDVGLFGDAVGRSSLALALNPDLSIARLVLATARELSGDHRGADQAIDEGLATSSPVARMLSVVGGARIALWRGREADIDAFAKRAAHLRGMPFIGAMIGALTKEASLDELRLSFGPAPLSPAWGRQYCMQLVFEVELAVHTGDAARATRCVERVVELGSHDEAWISLSPMAKRLPDVPEIQAARGVIRRRAEAVRRKMTESGLVGSPRGRSGARRAP